MSATQIRIEFTAVVEDPDHWPDGAREECEGSPRGYSYDSWVADQLSQAMHDAGMAFIDAHPGLFRLQELF